MSNASMIEELLEEHADSLTEWECDFLESLRGHDDVENISFERQRKLEQIYEERAR